jgi:hypothetical protein
MAVQSVNDLQQTRNEVLPPPGKCAWTDNHLGAILQWFKTTNPNLQAGDLSDAFMCLLRVALTAVLQHLSHKGDLPSSVVEWLTNVLTPVVFRNCPMTPAQAEMAQVLLKILDCLGSNVIPGVVPP